MKNIYFAFCVLFSTVVFSQNHWKQYNNKPLKKVTYYNTEQSLDTTNAPKTELYYYPNGFIEKSIYVNPNFQQKRFYFYKNDTLQKVVTQFVEQGEVSSYDVEQVLQNHQKIYLKSAKVFSQYNFYTNETSGEVVRLENAYNKDDYMIQSTKQNESYNDRNYFEISKNTYHKGDIQNSSFKIFSVDQITNDTVVEYHMESEYNVLDKNKIGPTAFRIINQQDTVYQKIVYSLYKKNEVKNPDINYTSLQDILPVNLEELSYVDLSEKGFNLLLSQFEEVDFNKALPAQNKSNTIEDWEQVFAIYIEKSLDRLDFVSALAATEALLSVEVNQFSFQTLFALHSVAFGINSDQENWREAKKHVQQLIQLQQEDENQYGAEMLRAELAKIEVKLNNKEEAQSLLNQLLNYQEQLKEKTIKLKGIVNLSYEEVEYQVNYNNFTFRIADLYALMGETEQAKKIAQDNLKDLNFLEEAGYPQDFFYKAIDQNQALLNDLNK